MSSYQNNKNTWLVCGVIIGCTGVILSTIFLCNIKITKDAINLVEEAIKLSNSVGSPILLVPILQSLLQVFVIFWLVLVASFLATEPEYRVVHACSFETVTNPDTGKMFALNDICDPKTFGESTGCPKAQCMHNNTFGPLYWGYWLQVWNFCGILWLLLFVHSLGGRLMSGTFNQLHWTEGVEGYQSGVGVWNSLKITCKDQMWTSFKNTYSDQLCTPACESLLTFFRSVKGGYVISLTSMVKILLFTVKLLLVGIVAAVTVAMFSAQVGSSLDIHLNYIWAPILVVILGSFSIISSFFSVYSIAVDIIVEEENEGQIC